MDLFDLIVIDLVREIEGKQGRRPGLKRLQHAIGAGEKAVRRRLAALEAEKKIGPRRNITPKKKPPTPEATARYMAGKRRREEVKKRAAQPATQV